jgi:hypothetical protein
MKKFLQVATITAMLSSNTNANISENELISNILNEFKNVNLQELH